MIPEREIDPEDSVHIHLGDAFEHEAALMDDAYLRQHCEAVDAQGEARERLRGLLREWDEMVATRGSPYHPLLVQIIEAAREVVRG